MPSSPIGKLLRVAKAPSLGRAPTSSDYYLRQQEFFIREIQPHLGEHAVSQELVVLHKSGIVDDLNAMLRDMNHQRKPKFQGSFIGHASWGFLVEDMRPNGEYLSHMLTSKLLYSNAALSTFCGHVLTRQSKATMAPSLSSSNPSGCYSHPAPLKAPSDAGSVRWNFATI